MGITTKFAIATEQGLDTLTQLARMVDAETYTTQFTSSELDAYLSKKYHRNNLIANLNSLSNQYIIIYKEDTPVGYACISSAGTKPVNIKNEKAIKIVDLGILNLYKEEDIENILLEKCLSLSKIYSYIWIEVPVESKLIYLLKSNNFEQQEAVPLKMISFIKKI